MNFEPLIWGSGVFLVLGGFALIVRAWKQGDHQRVLEDRLDRAEDRYDQLCRQAGEQTTIISQLLYLVSATTPIPHQTEAVAEPVQEPQHLLPGEIVANMSIIIRTPAARRTPEQFEFVRTHWNDEVCAILLEDGDQKKESLEAFARGARRHPTPPDIADLINDSLARMRAPDDLSALDLTATGYQRAITGT